MRPEEGAISPAATLSRVDLPQPVGPTIATNSPAATASEASSTAAYVPPAASRNLTLTCESETAGGATGAAPAPPRPVRPRPPLPPAAPHLPHLVPSPPGPLPPLIVRPLPA